MSSIATLAHKLARMTEHANMLVYGPHRSITILDDGEMLISGEDGSEMQRSELESLRMQGHRLVVRCIPPGYLKYM